MTIGFDYDGTLNSKEAKKLFKIIVENLNKCNLIIITNRMDVDDDITKDIKEIGFKEVLVYALGNTDYHNKAAFIADEDLQFDIFFEDNDEEIRALSEIGISCFKVPGDSV